MLLPWRKSHVFTFQFSWNCIMPARKKFIQCIMDIHIFILFWFDHEIYSIICIEVRSFLSDSAYSICFYRLSNILQTSLSVLTKSGWETSVFQSPDSAKMRAVLKSGHLDFVHPDFIPINRELCSLNETHRRPTPSHPLAFTFRLC